LAGFWPMHHNFLDAVENSADRQAAQANESV